MTAPSNPYHRWLGLDAGLDQPSYYELFGLDAFEAERSRIVDEADRTVARVRAIRPGAEGKAWAHLLDELKEARATLVDPARKADYDRQLRTGQHGRTVHAAGEADGPEVAQVNLDASLYPPGMVPPNASPGGKSAPGSASKMPTTKSPTTETPTTETPTTKSPALDPMAPLDVSAHQHAGSVDPMAPYAHDAEFARSDSPPATSVANKVDPAAVPMAPLPVGGVADQPDFEAATATDMSAADSPIASEPSPGQPVVTVPRARQPRASQLPVLIGVCLGAICLAGAVLWVAVNPGSTGSVGSDDEPLAAGPGGTNTPAAQSPLDPPRTPVKPPGSGGNTTTTAAGSPSKPPSEKDADDPDVNASPPDEPEPPAMQPDTPNSDPTNPPGDPPDGGSPMLMNQPRPDPPPENTTPAPKPNLARFVAAMKLAKAALAEWNYEVANEQLALSAEWAGSPEQTAMVERLRKVAQYNQTFWGAVRNTVGRFDGGEQFAVGPTVVIVVETGPDWITIRYRGMNRRFPLADLEPGLAVALAEQSLAVTDPMTRVLKGAYVLVQKTVKQEDLDKARMWWEEAQLGGVDLTELMEVWNDDYDALLATASPPVDVATPASPGMNPDAAPSVPVFVPPAELAEALQAVRNSLARADMVAAEQHLKEADSLAESEAERKLVGQFRGVAEYVGTFWEAVAKSVEGLAKDETFMVGSTECQVVGTSPNSLTVKYLGITQEIALADLRPGMARALALMSLDPAAPQSKVAEGAYLFVEQDVAASQRQRGQQLWQEAAAAGFDLSALLPIWNGM